MSRKRTSKRSRPRASLVGSPMPNVDVEDYEYEYIRPGCYFTPQVVRQATPYTCGACLPEYPTPWSTCNGATYVADSYGMVNYRNDFEHFLQLPNSLTLQTEITAYHYHYDKDEHDEEDINDEEDAIVSPRKRERYEYDEEFDPPYDRMSCNASHDLNKTPNSSRVYRSEEGYLVEEPIDEPAPETQTAK